MTHWLLANPKAGDGDRGEHFWREHLTAAGITDLTTVDLEDQSWMRDVAAGDLVLAAGGDGSVNRAALLCVDTGATLAVLPSGTANDFSRNLDLPGDPSELCELVASEKAMQVDVARFGERLLLNVAHVGLGTLPASQSSSQTKRFLGRFSYGLTLLTRVSLRRGFRAEIKTDEGSIHGRWLSIAVAMGAYFGGGNTVPGASLDQGRLSIVGVPSRSIPELLITLLSLGLLRRSPRRAENVVFRHSSHCEIHTSRRKTLTIDGDIAGKTPLRVTCQPRALRVIARNIMRP